MATDSHLDGLRLDMGKKADAPSGVEILDFIFSYIFFYEIQTFSIYIRAC